MPRQGKVADWLGWRDKEVAGDMGGLILLEY